MVARLLAYNVADVLQAQTKISGDNSEELFTQSIAVIDKKPEFRTAKVMLMAHGVPEFKWIKESLRMHWLEKDQKTVSK